MRKKNLFIVASPLQFINAIEAKNHFQTNNNILVLIYNKLENENDANQQLNLLVEKDWDQIIHYNLENIYKYTRVFYQVNLIKYFKKYNFSYIFSGEFGSMNQIILANLTTDQIYLLDDGTATIFTYQKLLDTNYFSKLSFYKKLKLLRYKFFNLEYNIKQNINFFTIYNIKSLNNIKVKKHDFNYLKSNIIKNVKSTKNIYFLGQNLAENSYMTEDSYLKYIKKTIKYFDHNIIYIPHRSETITEKYNSLISEKFIIQKSNAPIETTLINKKISPIIIISFFSSALFTLEKIFTNSKIYAIKLDKNDIESDKVDIVKNCYNFFNQTNIKLLNLDNLECSQ